MKVLRTVLSLVLWSAVALVILVGYFYGHSQRWFADTGHSGWLVKNGHHYDVIENRVFEQPESARVVIFNHGNNNPSVVHQCTPVIPDSILFLQSYGIHIYNLCSKTTEPLSSFILPNRSGRQVFSKLDENELVLDQLLSLGLLAENIYLSGQSQGGWVSLMAASRFSHKFNAAIAFAPGFGGYRNTTAGQFRRRNSAYQIDEMLKAPQLNALIFSYDNDSFTRPDELKFLVEHYGEQVTLVNYDCGLKESHFTAYRDCRIEETKKRVAELVGIQL